jgi:hypothetical protein
MMMMMMMMMVITNLLVREPEELDFSRSRSISFQHRC